MKFGRWRLVIALLCLFTAKPIFSAKNNFESHRLGDVAYTVGMLGVYGIFHGLSPLNHEGWWENTPTSLSLKTETVPVPVLLAGEIVLTGLALFPMSKHANSEQRQQGAMLILQSQATSAALNSVGKWFFGRRRPDYQERQNRLNQANEQLAANPGDVYWQEQVKKWDKKVLDGRGSFWSGHATEAGTVLSAIQFYVWNNTGQSRNIRLAVTGGLSAGIGFVGSSRIVDHRHHVGDVLTGFVVGTLSSTVVYRYQYGQWPCQHTKDGWGLVLTHTSGIVGGWLLARIFK